MEKEFNIIVSSGVGTRLDVFLAGEAEVSRSQIDKIINAGLVLVNNQPQKSGYRIRKDDHVIFTLTDPKEISARPENIPISIVYEDKDIIVLNKPRGIVVHPATTSPDGTLVNALLFHCKDLSGIGGCIRPGVVHRLDKDTSGLIVFAKNDNAHENLSKQIKDRKVKKTYVALVYGHVKADEGTIDAPLGRNPKDRHKIAVIWSDKLKKRNALTHYKVLKRYPGYTLLELDLMTGRTHQIRVHLSHIGHPIVGDMLYSRRRAKDGIHGQLLHAERLAFHHPSTGHLMEFCVELPQDFKEILKQISSGL